MLSARRCAGLRSPNCSTRSTSLPIRAASAWISPVSSRSASPRPISRSCAAPEIPASGLRISCASIAAMPVTDRAAERWPRLRSIFSAMPCGCIRIRISPFALATAAWRARSAARGRWSAQPTMTLYCATDTPLRRAWPDHVEHGAVAAEETARAAARSSAAARSPRSSRSPGWRSRCVARVHHQRRIGDRAPEHLEAVAVIAATRASAASLAAGKRDAAGEGRQPMSCQKNGRLRQYALRTYRHTPKP